MTTTLPTVRNVPFFNYPSLFTPQEEQFVEIFRDVGRRGAFILQRELVDFEKHFADYLGVRYALGVANATDGLHIALRAAGVCAGDEVILSSHTMIATASAVHFAGAKPIPVECGRDRLINPLAVAAAVTPRTRAILPTQLNGRTCDMDALGEIASKHNLLIVEDAAQALGAKFKGRCAGSFGASAAFSFYPAKTLGCFGDGGAVVTNDADTYERLCLLRDHGRNHDGKVVTWGLNSRLDNLQAALLDFQFKNYTDVVNRRRDMARFYEAHLRDVSELLLPPAPDSDPSHYDIFQNYEVEAERRDQLKLFLRERGIGTLIQWNGQPVHHCKELGFKEELPYTDHVFSRLLMLPLNMSLKNDDLDYVCETIREFYGY